MAQKQGKAKIKKGWVCAECGKRLPRRGYVWSARYQHYVDSDRTSSGLYCDLCAFEREACREY